MYDLFKNSVQTSSPLPNSMNFRKRVQRTIPLTTSVCYILLTSNYIASTKKTPYIAHAMA